MKQTHLRKSEERALVAKLEHTLREETQKVSRVCDDQRLSRLWTLGRTFDDTVTRCGVCPEASARLAVSIAQGLTQEAHDSLFPHRLTDACRLYRAYPDLYRDGRPPLTLAHYLILSRLENRHERTFYHKGAEHGGWSVSTLEAMIRSRLYERLQLMTSERERLRLLRDEITRYDRNGTRNRLSDDRLGFRLLELFLAYDAFTLDGTGRSQRPAHEAVRFVLYHKTLRSCLPVGWTVAITDTSLSERLRLCLRSFEQQPREHDRVTPIGIALTLRPDASRTVYVYPPTVTRDVVAWTKACLPRPEDLSEKLNRLLAESG